MALALRPRSLQYLDEDDDTGSEKYPRDDDRSTSTRGSIQFISVKRRVNPLAFESRERIRFRPTRKMTPIGIFFVWEQNFHFRHQSIEKSIFSFVTKIQIFSSKSITAYVDGIFSIMCGVTEHVLPPDDFYWFHNGSKIDFTSHRGGGISLENIQHRKSSSSLLKIVYSTFEDSGLYECQPVGGFEDAIVLRNFSVVHVEERPKPFLFFSNANV
ncbi:hypothetical protein TCAL_15893, partial [Tigriopus californicus]